MVNNNLESELVWYNGMVKELGLVGLGEIEEEDNGEFVVGYDPNLLTVQQAQNLVSIAERDGFFPETFLDVSNEKVEFRKGNVK